MHISRFFLRSNSDPTDEKLHGLLRCCQNKITKIFYTNVFPSPKNINDIGDRCILWVFDNMKFLWMSLCFSYEFFGLRFRNTRFPMIFPEDRHVWCPKKGVFWMIYIDIVEHKTTHNMAQGVLPLQTSQKPRVVGEYMFLN